MESLESLKGIPKPYVEEYVKCSASQWHFIENYVYISDPVRGKIKMEPWPHLHGLVDIIEKKDRVIILKARQIGVTWLLAALAAWYARFRPNATVVVISKDGPAAARFKWRSKFIIRNLPDWLQLPVGRDNDFEYEFPSIDSRILSLAAGEEAGRSETATIVILDEWAFQEYDRTIYTAILPIVERGKLVGISTWNTENTLFADIWAKAKRKENSYIPVFIGYNIRPGRGPAWWEATRKDAESDAKHRQEYPRTEADAMAAIEGSRFDSEALDRMPIREGKNIFQYSTQWQEFDENEWYVAGIDPAPGGGDYATLHILNSAGEQVALCRSNDGVDLFAEDAFRLLESYGFPYVIIERQGEGGAVIRHFLSNTGYRGEEKRTYPQHRLYRSSKSGKNFGWHTTAANREHIIGELAGVIRREDIKFYDQNTVAEHKGFRLNPKKNKYEGLYGHDDTVMAMALTYHAAQLSKPPAPVEVRNWLDTPSSSDRPSPVELVDEINWNQVNPMECRVTLREPDKPPRICGLIHNSLETLKTCQHQ